MNLHEKYMNRCLVLAMKAFGRVAPNPMVGSVIVHNNKVIGEGYHRQHGIAHAEVNAINSVKDKSLLRNSTLYVNLEPCSHFGKTPPCTDHIIRYKIKYVVIGSMDSNPIVKGKGIYKLAAAGCDVKVGVLENECRELNKRFYTCHEKKRPYIILKWAKTKNNYIGINDFLEGRLKITDSKANKLVHKWRSEEQAIMVGTNTALTDNPKLTVRNVKGKNPLRILIDKDLKVPPHFHLMDGTAPTIIFTDRKKSSKENLEYITIDFRKNILKQIMNELHTRQIQSLIVEGGEKLLKSFIELDLWDEARVFTSNKKLFELSKETKGISSPEISGKIITQEEIGNDTLTVIRNTFSSSQ